MIAPVAAGLLTTTILGFMATYVCIGGACTIIVALVATAGCATVIIFVVTIEAGIATI
jgi:hypothetical protein